MTRGTIIALALALAAAGCLGRYTPGSEPQPEPSAPSPPSASAPSSPSSPAPSTPTSPAPAPPQSPPAASDGGTATPPPADGGSPSACAQLEACCQLLPADQVQGCLDQVAGLDEQICQGILDQLQDNGYCL